jgi:hypothetical protein
MAGLNGGQSKRYLMRADNMDVAADWCQVFLSILSNRFYRAHPTPSNHLVPSLSSDRTYPALFYTIPLSEIAPRERADP